MPNYVKNRIELKGDQKLIDDLVSRFSTLVEKKPNRAYDNDIICVDVNGSLAGWFNEETNQFKPSNDQDNILNRIPAGVQYSYIDEFLHFPDFNKVVEMPQDLMVKSGSLGDTGLAVISGKSTNEYIHISKFLDNFYSYEDDVKIECIELGLQYIKNIRKYGHATWYTWCTDNWGTKWNSSSCESIEKNVYTFQTAWSSVIHLIRLIAKDFPDVEIYYKWADEDTSYNCGHASFIKGVEIINELDGGTKEAFELAFELWPGDKQLYEFIDGNYSYKDED